MVKVDYVDGSNEIIETKENKVTKFYRAHFRYDKENKIFSVHDSNDELDCMMIPREFVKSIRHIDA